MKFSPPCSRLLCLFMCVIASSAAYSEQAIEPIEVRTQFASDAVVTTVSHNAMGTTFNITLVGTPGKDTPSSLARIANEAFAEIDALESRISSWRTDSQTSQINRYAFDKPVRVTPTVVSFLLNAQRLYRETDGAFDCTVGPLIALWRAARSTETLPTQAEIDAARSRTGFDKVTIDPKNGSVRFSMSGIQLNFGAIGKGHALDVAAEVLKLYGVKIALLDGGTSTYLVTGTPPGQPGWTVRVRQPYNDSEALTTVVLSEGAFSTSTNADSKLVVDGGEYGHILDPRTGWPARRKYLAMSMAASAADADALSTAFYVMDVEEVRAYCNKHPDVRAIVVAERDSGEPEEVRINFEQQRGLNDE